MFARQHQTHEIYRYSPAFAVLTSPFAALSQGIGNAAWKLTNVGVFALGLWVWCRHVLPKPLTHDQVAAVFLLALPVAASSFYNGQANLMMTGFVLLGLTAAVDDRWWLAAGCLAAATLIKAFPFALALVVAALFWRTFPLRFLVALSVGLTIPFATQRPEYVLNQTQQWFRHLSESVELNRDRLRSLDKLLELSGASVEPKAFVLFGALAGAAVLATAVWTRRRGADRQEVLLRVVSWFLTWVVLFSPSSEDATYAILAPVVGWAVMNAFRRPGAWGRRVWLVVSWFLLGPWLGALLGPGDALSHPLGCCWLTVGGVMFQTVLAADLLTDRAAGGYQSRSD
jgi:hypothetical protein